MAKTEAWFSVDRRGLGQLIARRGREHAIVELVSNALDTEAGRIEVQLSPADTRGWSEIRVSDDDPNGFANLADAWTLFAPSNRKTDPGKRGRFNLGEKLALSLCRQATITTVGKTVTFDGDGRQLYPRGSSKGSCFEAVIRLNADERDRAVALLRRLCVPHRVRLTVNGEPVPPHELRSIMETTLTTEVMDDEGALVRRRRRTKVQILYPRDGEKGAIYELGVPVVETGDPWHVNVGQKVPLNLERDNVPPAYLRRLRALTLDATRDTLTEAGSREAWVTEALESPTLSDASVEAVVSARYGDRRAIADPSDSEATREAASRGYTVVHGGAFSRAAWDRIKGAGLLKPAGQVTPVPRPNTSPGGKDCRLPRDRWKSNAAPLVDHLLALAHPLIGRSITVSIENWSGTSDHQFGATYGGGHLAFNVARLGWRFFEADPILPDERLERVYRLFIHELAHDRVSDHLSHDYHEECCRLGARLAIVITKGVA